MSSLTDSEQRDCDSNACRESDAGLYTVDKKDVTLAQAIQCTPSSSYSMLDATKRMLDASKQAQSLPFCPIWTTKDCCQGAQWDCKRHLSPAQYLMSNVLVCMFEN